MFDCLSAFGHKKRADTFSESLAPGFVVFQHTKERLSPIIDILSGWLQPPIHHCLLMVDWVVSPCFTVILMSLE